MVREQAAPMKPSGYMVSFGWLDEFTLDTTREFMVFSPSCIHSLPFRRCRSLRPTQRGTEMGNVAYQLKVGMPRRPNYKHDEYSTIRVVASLDDERHVPWIEVCP
jgi:hypothetical protein